MGYYIMPLKIQIKLYTLFIWIFWKQHDVRRPASANSRHQGEFDAVRHIRINLPVSKPPVSRQHPG